MAWAAGPLACVGLMVWRPLVSGEERRPPSFRAAFHASKFVLEVPGRLAVAHHHDRRLLARAAAQGALGRAEQHGAALGSPELRLLRCSKCRFLRCTRLICSAPADQRATSTLGMQQSRCKLMVNSKIDELQSFAKRVFVASRPAGPRGPSPRQPTPRPRGGNPDAPHSHHLREAESRRCPRERRPGERGRHDVGAPRRGPEAARGR